MANIRISQLPPAQTAITGSELVPIVQNGQTVQTTVSAITASPSLTQTFLTVTAQSTLPNSRYIGTGLGLGSSDGGSGGIYNIFLNGVSSSLENASQGIIVKNSATTVINRTLSVSGSGLSISNGNGISGNPIFSLTGLVQALATTAGTGLLQTDGTNISVASIAGTTNQISVLNGNTNPIIGLATNPVLPGTASATVPIGNTSARPSSPVNGMIRYNTDSASFEVYSNNNWGIIVSGSGVSSFSAGSTGLTPTIAATGAVVLGGTLNVSNGGTGATTLTGYVKGNGIALMTASTTVPTTDLSGTVTNAQLANSSITINGNTVSLGGSTTVTASTTSTLTIGTGLTGTSFNGSVPVTIAIDSTVATLTGVQTLTNKTISGANNTLTNIGNSSLTNSSVTYNGVAVALGASGTITATATNALTIGTGLSGTSYNGSAAVTIANTGVLSFSGGTTGLTPNTATTGVVTLAGTLAIANGGTGLTATPSNGQIDIGNGTGFTRTTLTAGTGITITNGAGSITPSITATGVTAGTYGSASVIPVLTINAQGQVTSISTQATNAPAYQGTWNANTNSPTLTSSVGTAGYYYVVTTAGNTTLNGVSGWNIGDWAIFSNGAWQKIPGSTTESFTNLITTNLQVGGLTGFVYANNTTGYATAATTAQLLSLLGTTPVANGGTGLTSLTAGSLVYGAGTSAFNTLAIGTNGQILTSNGTAPVWSTLSGVAVTTFSGGTTGLTPSTATSGSITLGGTLVVSNGGTGLTSLTANYIPYGNNTSAFQSSANHTFDGTTLTLGIAGVNARFQGDFSNATVASRTAFVTGTTNGSTGIYALPNGTSTAASWQAVNNSSPTNASKILIATNGSTDVQLVSGINGTGTYLPLTFWNNGAEKARLSVSGGFSIGIATDAGSTNLLVAGTATALGGISGGTF
jgi:hypothetical protein